MTRHPTGVNLENYINNNCTSSILLNPEQTQKFHEPVYECRNIKIIKSLNNKSKEELNFIQLLSSKKIIPKIYNIFFNAKQSYYVMEKYNYNCKEYLSVIEDNEVKIKSLFVKLNSLIENIQRINYPDTNTYKIHFTDFKLANLVFKSKDEQLRFIDIDLSYISRIHTSKLNFSKIVYKLLFNLELVGEILQYIPKYSFLKEILFDEHSIFNNIYDIITRNRVKYNEIEKIILDISLIDIKNDELKDKLKKNNELFKYILEICEFINNIYINNRDYSIFRYILIFFHNIYINDILKKNFQIIKLYSNSNIEILYNHIVLYINESHFEEVKYIYFYICLIFVYIYNLKIYLDKCTESKFSIKYNNKDEKEDLQIFYLKLNQKMIIPSIKILSNGSFFKDESNDDKNTFSYETENYYYLKNNIDIFIKYRDYSDINKNLRAIYNEFIKLIDRLKNFYDDDNIYYFYLDYNNLVYTDTTKLRLVDIILSDIKIIEHKYADSSKIIYILLFNLYLCVIFFNNFEVNSSYKENVIKFLIEIKNNIDQIIKIDDELKNQLKSLAFDFFEKDDEKDNNKYNEKLKELFTNSEDKDMNNFYNFLSDIDEYLDYIYIIWYLGKIIDTLNYILNNKNKFFNFKQHFSKNLLNIINYYNKNIDEKNIEATIIKNKDQQSHYIYIFLIIVLFDILIDEFSTLEVIMKQDMQNKYLKYKQKYLILKNKI